MNLEDGGQSSADRSLTSRLASLNLFYLFFQLLGPSSLFLVWAPPYWKKINVCSDNTVYLTVVPTKFLYLHLSFIGLIELYIIHCKNGYHYLLTVYFFNK